MLAYYALNPQLTKSYFTFTAAGWGTQARDKITNAHPGEAGLQSLWSFDRRTPLPDSWVTEMPNQQKPWQRGAIVKDSRTWWRAPRVVKLVINNTQKPRSIQSHICLALKTQWSDTSASVIRREIGLAVQETDGFLTEFPGSCASEQTNPGHIVCACPDNNKNILHYVSSYFHYVKQRQSNRFASPWCTASFDRPLI